MLRTVRYLTHPQVLIDPEKPVPRWSLSDVGKHRVDKLARSGALAGVQHVISSAESKAIETASPLANALGLDVVIRDAMHENDRSATGFLPSQEFEHVADQFFTNPDQSVRGWETARAAQSRIVSEVQTCLRTYAQGDVLFVGHGGVGTLLFCHLSGVSISRAYDQGAGGGGNYFAFLGPDKAPIAGWKPLEHLIDQTQD